MRERERESDEISNGDKESALVNMKISSQLTTFTMSDSSIRLHKCFSWHLCRILDCCCHVCRIITDSSRKTVSRSKTIKVCQMNTNPCARNPLKSIGTLKESLGRDAMVYLTSESAYSIQVAVDSRRVMLQLSVKSWHRQ